MKDSLHFILFGVFCVLGLGLMGWGVMSKMGSGSDLVTARDQVQAAAKKSPPSTGDLRALESEQANFVKAVSDMEVSFRDVEGQKLMLSEKPYTNVDDFYTNVVLRSVDDLTKRFAALKKPPALPKALEELNRKLVEEDESALFWSTLKQDMSVGKLTVAEIPMAQAKLKVIADVCVACERLLSSEQFKGTPFTFRKFEFPNFGTEPAREEKEPWLKHEFLLVFNADPSLGLALMDALLNPIPVTVSAGTVKRDAIPYELISLTGYQSARPHETGYEIKPEDRKKWDIPAEWDEGQAENPMDSGGSDSKRKTIARKLQDENKISVPLTYELKLFALRANAEWTPIFKAVATEQ